MDSQTRPKVQYKTFKYNTSLTWIEHRNGTQASAGKPDLRVSSPPEFKGEPGMWTPEDLFVASVESCMMTTFLSLADREGINVVSYTSTAEGLLQHVDGDYRITDIEVRPHVVVTSAVSADDVKRIMAKAHDKCLIANSATSVITVITEVTPAA